jgi:hypothetical protein
MFSNHGVDMLGLFNKLSASSSVYNIRSCVYCSDLVQGHLECPLHIRDEVLRILNADAQTNEVVGNPKRLALRCRDAAVRHLRRELRQTLNTAERLGEGEEPCRSQETLRRRAATTDAEGDHAAVRESGVVRRRIRVERGAVVIGRGDGRPPCTAVHILARLRGERSAGNSVAGVAGKAWVDHGVDVRALLERSGDRDRVCAMRLHAEMERLRSTLCEPAVECARDCTGRVLEETELLRELRAVRRDDERAHDDIRVAVDVLGHAMHDDIRAKEKWGLVVWREEGVVHDYERLRGVRVREADNPGDVDDAKGRVCRGLDPHQLRLCTESGEDGLVVGVLQVHESRVDALGLLRHAGHVTEGAAVYVVNGYDVGTRTERLDHCRSGCRARRKRQCGGSSALDRGQSLL